MSKMYFSRTSLLIILVGGFTISMIEGFLIKPMGSTGKMLLLKSRSKSILSMKASSSSSHMDRRDALKTVGKVLGFSAMALGAVGQSSRRVEAAVGEGT